MKLWKVEAWMPHGTSITATMNNRKLRRICARDVIEAEDRDRAEELFREGHTVSAGRGLTVTPYQSK